MLLLFETPAGYSLFKVKDEKKLEDAEVGVMCAERRARTRGWTRARAVLGDGVCVRVRELG